MRLWTTLETFFLLLVLTVVSAAGAGAYFIGPEWVSPAMILAGIISLAWLVISGRRRLVVWLEYERAQTQALVNLHATLPVRAPLPPMTAWAATPEFIALALEHIEMSALEKRKAEAGPLTIVECGSGVSTLLVAYALQAEGEGMIYSLEHDEDYAEVADQRLSLHGLRKHAQVVHAPIHKQSFHGKQRRWYNTARLKLKAPIDVMIIDGPPKSTARQARYPAFPKFRDQLADDAWILLDDAARAGERAVVSRWLDEAEDELEVRYVDGPKGAAVLKFKRKPTEDTEESVE
jgi:predicted O-methyltransferase YrrM